MATSLETSYSFKLAPSILSGDFACLGEELKRLNHTECHYIHLDVMDGHFVPNLTFGAPMVKALRPHSKKIFDVHLMMSEPERYLDDFIDAGSDIISIHKEIKGDVRSVLKRIRQAGKRASLAIHPHTPVDALEDFFPLIDQLLLMSVIPGFAKQKFLPGTLDRGRQICDAFRLAEVSIDLEIDGGVCAENLEAIIAAGFNVVVAGTYLFAQENLGTAIQEVYARVNTISKNNQKYYSHLKRKEVSS